MRMGAVLGDCQPYGGGSCGAKVVYICPVLSPTPFRLRINPTTRTVTYVTPHHTNTLTRQRGKADIAEASTTHRPVSTGGHSGKPFLKGINT